MKARIPVTKDPAAVLLYIDNMDELLQNARDSERAQLSGRVETLIEDWASSTTGVLRKYSSDRFLLIVEQRHLQHISSTCHKSPQRQRPGISHENLRRKYIKQ